MARGKKKKKGNQQGPPDHDPPSEPLAQQMQSSTKTTGNRAPQKAINQELETSAALRNGWKHERAEEAPTGSVIERVYVFLRDVFVRLCYWLWSTVFGKSSSTSQLIESHPFEPEVIDTGNIPENLISGEIPAVTLADNGWELKYVPLVRGPGDEKKPELIRVLTVHADARDKDLECSIDVILLPQAKKFLNIEGKETSDPAVERYRSLGKTQKYIALSYSWESQTPSETIYIRHSKARGGKLPFLVTRNLKAALLQFRDSKADQTFWADAVCMDQNNKAEKSQQLPLMPRIYGEASRVYVWLGNKDSPEAKANMDRKPDKDDGDIDETLKKVDISKAFGLIRKIRKWEDYKFVVEKNTKCEEWVAFIALMNRNWFRRRWIVQEIVLAGEDHAELFWGSEHVPWVEFAQAVAFFEGGLQDRVKDLFRANSEYENHPDKFGDIGEASASRLVKISAEIVSRRDDGRVARKRESLESLISLLTPFDAGQPHDIVYAVLSLAKDCSAGSPSVSLKPKLTIEKLSKEIRMGCKFHSLEEEKKVNLVAPIIWGISMLATFAIHTWVRKNHSQTTSWNKLNQQKFEVDVQHVFLWMLSTTVIYYTFRTVAFSIGKIYEWIVGILIGVYQLRVVQYILRTLRGRQRHLSQSAMNSLGPVYKCECERKLAVLNSILQRFKLEKFPVDYDKSFAEVCDDLYTFTTNQSGSLDIIFRPWCPEAPSIITTAEDEAKWLPTWVRPLEDRAFKPDKKHNMERTNADTLVGAPGLSPYQASGKFRISWKFERDNETQILSAPGFKLDTLESIAEAALSGVIPKNWLKKYRKPVGGEFAPSGNESNYISNKTVSTQFLRTMIAGKGPNGQNPPLSYSLVCQELFDTDDNINLINQRDRSTNDVLKRFIDRILSVIWDRKLGKTSKLQRLALLPQNTRKTDVICILYGCSVPVVLRQIEEKTSDGLNMWELIGECYVYEMMQGEALAERSSRLSKEREFYGDTVFKIR